MAIKSEKIYFPNLNGLRFIAAFLVIIHHLEQIKSLLRLPNYWTNPFISVVGKLGVILFFVLSGFLITYLLLEERKKTKTISIKKFYIRRILRIWPLYYLIVLLSFFVFPKISLFNFYPVSIYENFSLSLSLFFLFLPNIALNCFGIVVPYAAQSWSVGVEEQFYLIWPVLMKYVKSTIKVLLAIIFIYLLVKFFAFKVIEIMCVGGGGVSC